ncbi:stage II sporulation protein M [Arthrobacter sp. APC 3897]|uniref:stage II sporulation protein M n=1 Tax=Arthrobacter sp. APC 3897 TaxID=3035204 RepID=UPI0033A2D924
MKVKHDASGVKPTSLSWFFTGSWMLSVAPTVFLASILAGTVAGGLWWPAPYEPADLASASGSADTLAIAGNNLTLALSLFVLSAATAGLGAIVALFINGLIVGQLAVLLIDNSLGSMLLVGLLPHVFIEALGLCLVSSAGLLGPLIAVRLITQSVGPSATKAILIRSVALTTVGFTLIIVAAVVEGHISTVTW